MPFVCHAGSGSAVNVLGAWAVSADAERAPANASTDACSATTIARAALVQRRTEPPTTISCRPSADSFAARGPVAHGKRVPRGARADGPAITLSGSGTNRRVHDRSHLVATCPAVDRAR